MKIESQNLSPISKPPSNIASDNLCDFSNPEGEIVLIVEVIDDAKLIDDVKLIDDINLISGEITRESSDHKPGPTVSFSSSIAPVAPSSTTTSQLLSSPAIDIDEFYKLTSTPSKRGEKNLSEPVTKYTYICDSEIGHGINGQVPLLIEFNKSYCPKQLMALIAFFLKEVIRIKLKRITIIYFEVSNAPWLQLL